MSSFSLSFIKQLQEALSRTQSTDQRKKKNFHSQSRDLNQGLKDMHKYIAGGCSGVLFLSFLFNFAFQNLFLYMCKYIM